MAKADQSRAPEVGQGGPKSRPTNLPTAPVRPQTGPFQPILRALSPQSVPLAVDEFTDCPAGSPGMLQKSNGFGKKPKAVCPLQEPDIGLV